MKLHDITPTHTIPTWVQNVACAWYNAWRLTHMPLVYYPTEDRLAYTRNGEGNDRPNTPPTKVVRRTWYDWEQETQPNMAFDPNWVIVR